jgi:Zn-finger nucleic acid-binding protein
LLFYFLASAAALVRPPAPGGEAMFPPCPRCHVPLEAAEYGGFVLETCPRCGGRWTNPADLKAIIDGEPPPARAQAYRVAVDLTGVGGDSLCPRCSVPMEPFNYAGDSGVILDKCPGCAGLWLDSGDLERILAVVAASDRDLDRDMKRFSADLHEQEVRQDALEQQDTRPAGGPVAGSLAARIADADTRP